MRKKNRAISFVLMIFFLLQIVVAPSAGYSSASDIGAALGADGNPSVADLFASDDEDEPEDGAEDVIQGDYACNAVDVKKVTDQDDNYALSLSWRIRPDQPADSEFSLVIPKQFRLKAANEEPDTRGELLGHVMDSDNPDIALMDIYADGYILKFVLTDDGAAKAQEGYGIYGTTVLLNLTNDDIKLDDELVYTVVQNGKDELDIKDLVDETTLEELIDSDAFRQHEAEAAEKVAAKKAKPAQDKNSGQDELEIISTSAKVEEPAHPAAEPAASEAPATPEAPAAPATPQDAIAPEAPAQDMIDKENTDPGKPVVVLKAPGVHVLVAFKESEDADVSDSTKKGKASEADQAAESDAPIIYRLYKADDPSDKEILGRYALGEDKTLLFSNLKDGNYSFKQEGKRAAAIDFSIIDGQLYCLDKDIPDNVLEIAMGNSTGKNAPENGENEEDSEDVLNPEDSENQDITSENGKGMARVEIELVDEKGNPINPQGALYQVLQIRNGKLKKVKDLVWDDQQDVLAEHQAKQFLAKPQNAALTGVNPEKLLTTFNAFTLAQLNDTPAEAMHVFSTTLLEVPAGEYVLKEAKPPHGYAQADGQIELNVTEEAVDGNDKGKTPETPIVQPNKKSEEAKKEEAEKNEETEKVENPGPAEKNTAAEKTATPDPAGVLKATASADKSAPSPAAAPQVAKPEQPAVTDLATPKAAPTVARPLTADQVTDMVLQPVTLLTEKAAEAPFEEKPALKQASAIEKALQAAKATAENADAAPAGETADPAVSAEAPQGLSDNRIAEEEPSSDVAAETQVPDTAAFTVEAQTLTGTEKIKTAVDKTTADAEAPAHIRIAYMAAGAPTSTLNIRTQDKDGHKLFYGGTSSAEIGNLRDATLNHDATYAVYKYDETDKTYKPLNIYDKMVYDDTQNKEVVAKDAQGKPVTVNYKNGKFGVVTLDNLPAGKYVVKEVKSVFQYAFKNLAMTFTVGPDGTISNYKAAAVALADYEKDQTKPSTNEVERKKLTYTEKMVKDSERIIAESEVTEADNPNLKEITAPGTGKTIEATYHKGNLRVKKVDKAGNPIQGVTLELHGHDANRILRIYRVTTDAKGIAEFKDLNVPSYHLLKEVEAPKDYALPNHQWMIYFGEGTWVEFDANHKPKTEHIPLQISDNQVYATQVQLKPIIKLNPQETRQVVENDKYRPLIDGVTGASIAPKNWFQFLGINNPTSAPAEGTPEAEQYWSENWNKDGYFKGETYEKSFNKSKTELFYNTRETLKQATDDKNIYEFTVKNYPRAKVTVNKKDDQGNILPGATFAIYKVNEDGSQTSMKKGLNDWTEVSGLDGKAIFDNLPEGNYVIKEIKTPGGYSSDGRAYKVKVDKEANITFKDEISGVSHIYVNQEGSFGGAPYEKVTLSSMITGVDTTRKRFEVIYYLKATNSDGTGLSLGVFDGMAFTAKPYLAQKVGQITDDQLGSENSSGIKIDGFETYTINDAATDYMPTNRRPDFNDTSKYTKFASGQYIANNSLGFSGIGSPKGVIIRMVGAYDDKNGKPIFTQGSLAWGGHFCYSSAGVRLNKKEQDQTKQSELEFNVTNTRNKATPLDKKGAINISKLISETDTLLKDAEFGLYENTWDKIGPRDKPFATLKTGDSQIGDLTVAGKKVNLQFKDIPPGVYTLKELNAPVGYEKTLYTWTVRVFPSGVTLVNLNPTFEEDPTLEEPVNVNDKVHIKEDTFKFYINRDWGDENTPFYVNKNEFFKMDFSGTLDKGIKRGNYFTIDLDEKLSYGGTIVEDIIPDITLGDTGYVLATGKLDPATNQIKYTFTEIAESLNAVDVNFAFTLLPERSKIQYDGNHSFKIKIANQSFSTKTFTMNHSLFNNNISWVNDTYRNTRVSAFMNSISYERAEVEMAFYVVPTNTTTTTSRKLNVTIQDGIIPPITKSRYEIYEVLNPGIETNPNVSGQTYYRNMPASFGIDYSDTTKYRKVQEGYIQSQYQTTGTIPIESKNINKYLIARVISPFKVTDVQTEDEAKITIQSITTDSRYNANYPATAQVTSSISIKPSEVFSQTDLTEGEVLAFNKTKAPMKFTLWKKNMKNEVIKDGTVHFKMEVAEDYPDSTPVPDSWKDISLDLSKQTDAGDPTKSVPLEIKIPEGMTGEYNLIETAAPKGYVVNGMRYRIKVDSSKRTVQLISVKDSAGNPVDYKFKLPGTATKTLLTAKNPAPLYREETDASGKITVDTQLVSIDVLDPQGEYPHAGGLGILLLYALGMALMAYAARAVYKRKKAVATEKGGAD